MISLVTQADGSARQQPWVVYSLVLVLVATFLALAWDEPAPVGGATLEERLVAMDAYFERYPYVEMDARTRVQIGAARVDALRDEFTADREERGYGPPPERIVRMAQKRFDPLVAAAFELVYAKPVWRLGVADAATPGANYLRHLVADDSARALALGIVILLLAGIALEDAWGSLGFGALCAAGVVATGFTYATFCTELGRPWVGASGLAATLLGAAAVHSLRGAPRLLSAVPVPGWLLLPAALAAYVLWVYPAEGGGADLRTAPVYAVGVGLGAAFACVFWVFSLESKLRAGADAARELVSNPVLDGALSARSEGRPAEALSMLAAEYERAPGNSDVALALWDTARAAGQPEAAVEALLSVVREHLRLGRSRDAVRHWLDVVEVIDVVPADGTLLVRMGEALLDEGHPDAALAALRHAVSAQGGLASPLAQRVVRVARDLAPDLTRTAAAIALRNPELPLDQRENLERLVDAPVSAVAGSAAGRAAERPPAPRPSAVPIRGESDGGSEGENAAPAAGRAAQPAPVSASADFAPLGEGEMLAGPELVEDLVGVAAQAGEDPDGFEDLLQGPGPAEMPDENDEPFPDLEAQLNEGFDYDDDEHAPGRELHHVQPHPVPAIEDEGIAPDALSEELSLETSPDESEKWNEIDVIRDMSAELSDDTLSLDPSSGVSKRRTDAGAGPGAVDTDVTETLASDPSVCDDVTEEVEAGALAAGTAALVSEDQTEVDPPPPDRMPDRMAEPAPTPTPDLMAEPEPNPAPEPASDGLGEIAAFAGSARALRLRTAVPLRLADRGVSVEIDGGRKTTIPYDRIDAVAVGAVRGLADRPVVVVDLVLNWMALPNEPLKVVRLRSDRFDPRRLAPDAESALVALRTAIAEILDRSGATALPDGKGARGTPFQTFASLATYQSAVLVVKE